MLISEIKNDIYKKKEKKRKKINRINTPESPESILTEINN